MGVAVSEELLQEEQFRKPASFTALWNRKRLLRGQVLA
jgi:hypothetical protein